jgi:hypothetical protein
MPIPRLSGLLAFLSTLLCIFILGAYALAGVQFQPVNPDELKMTSEPLAPGAPAIILYREVDRNDCGITCKSPNVGLSSADRFEENYVRIKILTEAGRKYADVEIPLSNEVGSVANINARTIRPDGSIVKFKGQVIEKTIVKAKGYKYLAKTFAMPDVQVGSIIEYYYTISYAKNLIFFSNWILSQELFTKKAKFSLVPFQWAYGPITLRWSEHLPPGTPSPKQRPDDLVELEAVNIAAFQAEDFMPPENELKARVEFIYTSEPIDTDANKFWKRVGKSSNDMVEKFVGRRGAMEQALSQIVSPSDSPEVKLRKIYARVQQLRNTSYEVRKTEQEDKREKRKIEQEENVENIWKQGYGDEEQLNWLCLGLTRAAGIEAYGVLVADRSKYFFNPQSEQNERLDTNLVLVKLNGKDLYLDPGAAFTAFGMLRWDKTGVQGLRLDRDGGSWILTKLPDSSASRIERKADLKLSATGDLEGKLVVTFTGLEAQRRRVDERNEDDTARKKVLEDEVKGYITAGSEVELTKQPDWTGSEAPLVAELNLKVPGWAMLTGRRALFPVGIFGATEKNVFTYSTRTNPIYFWYPAQKLDDVTIELPAGWQISSLPAPQNQDLHVVGYALSAENNKGALHLKRKFDINILSMEVKYYGPMQSFFQIVRRGDEQQVVFALSTATVGN